MGLRGWSHQAKLPPVPDEENTLGGQPFYNANWCETQETVSDSGDDALSTCMCVHVNVCVCGPVCVCVL